MNGTFSFLHKNTFRFHGFPRSITNWIGFGLGWFGRFSTRCFSKKTVEQAFQLAVVQRWNPIDHSLKSNCDCVSMRSLVVVEETNIVFLTTFLQFSIFQLLKYNGLEVFLEEKLHSIVFDRMSIFRIARSISTQKTASWCLFHALYTYRARRGTEKSICSGSL